MASQPKALMLISNPKCNSQEKLGLARLLIRTSGYVGGIGVGGASGLVGQTGH